MPYFVQFTPAAEQGLAKLDQFAARRIKPKILALADQPRPPGSVKLTGAKNLHRIRIGDYRVVYQIDDSRRIIDITIIAHRREVYRDL